MASVFEYHTTSARPRLRGRLHQAAFFVSLPAGISLVTLTQTAAARVAVGIYAASLSILFAASAALHRVPWRPAVLRWMRGLDHSAIFVLIAASYTAFAVFTLEGVWLASTLLVMWTGAAVGSTLKLLKVDGFNRAVPTLYLGLGWFALLVMPWVAGRLGPLRTALLFLGGLSYTLGFLVLARGRPDPWPRIFGYYEIWHAMVIAGSAFHFTVILLLARG